MGPAARRPGGGQRGQGPRADTAEQVTRMKHAATRNVRRERSMISHRRCGSLQRRV